MIAVGVAMGVGIGTAELFLAQRDHAEEKAAEERNPAELHNPFGTMGERFEQGGGSSKAAVRAARVLAQTTEILPRESVRSAPGVSRSIQTPDACEER